jgi:hypothetical protein
MSECTEKATPEILGSNFESEIKRFASSIDSLLISLPSVMAAMEAELEKLFKELVEFAKKSGAEEIVEGNLVRYKLGGSNGAKLMKLDKNITKNQTAYRLIHRSFLTSLISQYDAYLGRLLHLMFYVHPEKLNGSEKPISFKDLLQYSSLEDARNQLIDREVDSIVRCSHEDQIKWITENLKIPIASFIPELPNFIEIAQRRHLFVHCDGVVSGLYIKNCVGAGAKLLPEIVVGHQLEVTKEYLENAFEKVYSVGVKIGFALWLNLFKSDSNKSASCVSFLAFDLITNARYSLAINLLEFAIGGKNKPSEEQLLRYIILNLAQSYKWSGDNARCSKILSDHNWSASSDIIKLGVAALSDKFDEAPRLMRKLGHDEEFKKEFYRDWPIFRELRKQPNFLSCYREIYGEDLEQVTVSSPA